MAANKDMSNATSTAIIVALIMILELTNTYAPKGNSKRLDRIEQRLEALMNDWSSVKND